MTDAEKLELREYIATRLMGLSKVRKERDLNYVQERYVLEYFSLGSGRPSGQIVGMDGGNYWREVPDYTGNIADAMSVVEKMPTRMWSFTWLPDARVWDVGFIDQLPLVTHEAPTLPLAICLAAKAALEAGEAK